jgi:Subtilase family
VPKAIWQRSRTRAVTVLTVGVGLATAGASPILPTASAAGAPATAAPVVGAAKNGGPVIVWLKDQHSNLNLRSQSTRRIDAAHQDQRPLVADIKAHGGTHVKRLVSVSAVAAHVSATEVQRLSADPAVRKIVPDSEVAVGVPALKVSAAAVRAARPAAPSQQPNCDTKRLQVEPEALTDIHAYSNDPGTPDMANSVATGEGVIVANDGINGLAGNPNFTRPDGSHVVIGAPDYTADNTNGEFYGDASSIAAQGTVVYDYAKELPFSGLPVGRCKFVLRGDAPDASLVDMDNNDYPGSSSRQSASITESESDIVAGIDAAVTKYHADVLSESYGYGLRPSSYATHYAANDAAVAAGVTVVVSSGDSGVQGTVSSPASDPRVIEVGATNTLRLNAQAYGYPHWVNDDITPLSSGGTTPNNKLPDLVAPGYGGEAACNPASSSCPSNTQTEAFGGTSQSCPLVAGAVADVIQAYRDSHDGVSPSPELVKQILTSTATETGAPADQQGAGLLDVYAAVKAAQELPGSTPHNGSARSLIVSTSSADASQVEVVGDGGSTVDQTVNLYNTDSRPTTVTGSYRTFSRPQQFGQTVTEDVSAPDPSQPLPAKGAEAAKAINFTVPPGLDRMTAEMIWPDATNANVLSFILTDPQGRLRQQSYDYGTASRDPSRPGSVPNFQRVEIAHPQPGRWHAEIVWANGRAHLQEPPNVPGSYTGTVRFRTLGQHFGTSAASGPVTIAGHSTEPVTLHLAMPQDPGDHPESVQFVAGDGARTSLPVARRTQIPAAGGFFHADIVGTVGRGTGQISTFVVPVSAGTTNVTVNLQTADTSPDNGFTAYLVHPSDGPLAASAPFTNGAATLSVANPDPGLWEIDIKLNLTMSGDEFDQAVSGSVASTAT